MALIDANDLQDRIDVLYHVTSDFVTRAPVAEICIEETSSVGEDGKETRQIHFGGGQLTRAEELSAKATLTDIVSRLANLKDPLKNAVANSSRNAQTVEDHINSSYHLGIIVDLNNAEKHGYPLTRHTRSGIDPRIENIRKELAIPLVSGKFSNALTDGIVLFEADIVDRGGNRAADFRELIENAITDWEDFCIANLASDSAAIIDRRDKQQREEAWALDHGSRGERVQQLIADEATWYDIQGDEIVPGMFVSATGFQENAATLMGFPTGQADTDTIVIFDVVFGQNASLGKTTNNWKIFTAAEQSDLKLVNDYYWELYNRPKF